MTIPTDAGAASGRARADRRSGDDVRHRVAWARSTDIDAPRGGQPSAPTRRGPWPTSASATRTPSSPSTTSTLSTSTPSVRPCPSVNLEIVAAGPDAALDHDAGPRTRRRDHRGVRHRGLRCRRGGVAVGTGRTARRETRGPHGWWTCKRWSRQRRRRRDDGVAQRPDHLRRNDRVPNPMSNTPYSEALGATLIERAVPRAHRPRRRRLPGGHRRGGRRQPRRARRTRRHRRRRRGGADDPAPRRARTARGSSARARPRNSASCAWPSTPTPSCSTTS